MATVKRKKKTKRRRSRKRKAPSCGWRCWLWRLSALGLLVLGLWVAWLNHSVTSRFEGQRWAMPAQVFASPLELYAGAPVDKATVLAELKALGYVAGSGKPGSYSQSGSSLTLHSRGFMFWDGEEPARKVTLRFSGNHIESLGGVDLMRLEPVLIGKMHPAHHEDRLLVPLDNVPEQLVQTLLEVEDRSFYDHFGLDPKGIARAAWANLRAGRVVQGGSTLTQQLAKNFFLTSKRSFWRKANEAIIALILEWHYEKDDLLNAYLNEIYLGQQGPRGIHGVGLAARFWFNKPVSELRLHESALLVGMIKGPSLYNPRRHPQRALKRRNQVLGILADRGVVSKSEADQASRRDLGVSRQAGSAARIYPAFLDLVRRQLRRDYDEEDLRESGLQIFTTLNLRAQAGAEKALTQRIVALEKSSAKIKKSQLQGAVVVSNVEDGEVLAVVGGRKASWAGFNRALDAVRPTGSLIKPAVYLNALERKHRYTLVSVLDDAPLSVQLENGDTWSPRNFDREHHGTMMLQTALASSSNTATVRLGLELGVQSVLGSLEELGVERDLLAVPSLFLGSAALSPLEVTQMYQTLAAGGFRSPLRSIREIVSADGEPLQRYPLTVNQAVPPEAAFVLRHALEEVTRTGTARSLQKRLPGLRLAGKTGTTNDLRDSWFAGFSGSHVAVVWLGADDNSSIGLTGSRGALPVWSSLMAAVPQRGLDDLAPPNIEWVDIDMTTGLIGDQGCEYSQRLPFIKGSAPTETAACHNGPSIFDSGPGGWLDNWFN